MANEDKPKKLSKNGKPLGRPTYASQGRKKKADTQTTYKIDVPNGDTTVNEWMSLQDDPSASVRLLIRQHVKQNGMVDITCMPVDYSPVGRKAAALKEMVETENETKNESDFESKPERKIEGPVKVTKPSVTTDDDDDDMSSIFNARR